MAAGFGASLPQRHQSFDEAALAGVALPNGLKSKTECLDTVLSFGKPLEIEKKSGGLVIAARVAAPDFVFDIRPDAFALAVNRVEPDPAGCKPWASPEEPVTNPLRHVGRNDPCPCGSVKKFKKCCLADLE